MKRVYASGKWCISGHLCEYSCSIADSEQRDMAKGLKNKPLFAGVGIEDSDKISYAFSYNYL